jgi:NAD(P)-dependent dehydrogenase (short-subunit alcohol dehydrogenase family)
VELQGKQVIIVGGSSGIGLATARRALAEGANVLIVGRSDARLDSAQKSLNSRYLTTAVADISDLKSVKALFANTRNIDHLFIPAGELTPDGGDVLSSDPVKLEQVIMTRLLGASQTVREARSRMSNGSVTLMSGVYAIRPGKGSAMGAAAVAGVEGMTRALALDLAPIRVNAVSPGIIDTPLWDSFGSNRQAIMDIGKSLPIGRVGHPDDIAEGVLFLMKNDFTTGTVLRIDGGGSLV